MEEALFLERMQPKLREYLTKLREEAEVDNQTGSGGHRGQRERNAVDLQRLYPSCSEEEEEICTAPASAARRSRSAQVETAKATAPATGGCRDDRRQPRQRPPRRHGGRATKPATTQQASNNDQKVRSRASERRFALGRLLASLSLFAGRHDAAPRSPDRTRLSPLLKRACKPRRHGERRDRQRRPNIRPA